MRELVRLAHANPHLRDDLHPTLLRIAAESLADLAKKAQTEWEFIKKLDRTTTLGWYQFRGAFARMLQAFIHIPSFILTTKKIPSGKHKELERAAHVFGRMAKLPSNPDSWVKKNAKHVDFMLAAVGWPDLGEASPDGEEKFTEGSFTVVNTVGATGPDLEAIRKLIRQAEARMRSSGIPGIRSVIYGDVYLVGKVAKAKWAAWYSSKDDHVFLRAKLPKGEPVDHTFIHEIGHRYWKKVLSAQQKKRWSTHHHEIGFTGYSEVTMPGVGDILPVEIKGYKGLPSVSRIDGNKYYLNGDDSGYFTSSQIMGLLRKTTMRLKYPTSYASSDPEEHFCESLAMYVLGTITERHRRPLEELLGI